MNRSVLVASLLVLFAATLFGSLGVLSRTAYAAGLVPFAFVAWRALFGAIGTWGVVLAGASPGRRLRDLRGRQAAAFAVAAIAASTLNLAMFLAFERATVALVLLGFYTNPALIAVGSAALGHERLDGPRLGALGLALAGMAAVVLGGLSDTDGAGDPSGILLALGAAASQAVFVLVSRSGYRDVAADRAMGGILVVAAVSAGVLAIATAGPDALLLPLREPAILPLLVFTGLFAAALPSFLFLSGIRRLGGVRTGILMLWEPVVGVALAAALLAEAVTPVQALGGAAILAAAFLLQRGAPASGPLVAEEVVV